MLTTSLNGPRWLAALGLALVLPVVIETSKWVRRRRTPASHPLDVAEAVAPVRVADGQG
jgi:Ca2+-transporting ATPase